MADCVRLLKRCWLAALMLAILTSLTACTFADTPEAQDAPAVANAVPAPPAAKPIEEHHGLALIDWAIIFVYAGATIGLGWYFSRRQDSTREYFVGTGHMNPILIGVSLFATLLSTISYLSQPGEALGKGPVFFTSMLAVPFVYLAVGYILLPVYMRQRVTSAYELLEAKLGLSIRLLGACMFISLRLVWMSLLVYLTAKAMVTMLGVGDDMIPYIALATGFVAVVYTSLGGLQAVVITDFLQTMLLFGGALLVIATVSFNEGGFGWFPTEWKSTWDTQPFFSSDPATRVTVIGTVFGYFIWQLCTAGGDQTSVQRFMATRDAKTARHAYGMQLTVNLVVTAALVLVGFALLSYFQRQPHLLPADWDLKKNADDIFPYFISYRLPVGVSGLVVSAMFAAAMSSVDSGVNSITAVVMTDFLDRFNKKPATEQDHLILAKVLAFSIGAATIIGSSFMGAVPGNITAVTQKTSNLLTTPIFCLFFFALFVPFATPIGVWCGAIAGVTTAVVTAFPQTFFGPHPVTGGDPISFQYIAPIAITANLVVGSMVSWLTKSTVRGVGDEEAS